MLLAGVEWCLDVQQKAQQQVLTALQINKDIVGIFGLNVFSAQGASQAVINAGLAGAVKMCLWDATVANIDNLKKGNADLVLAQKPGEMGSLAVEWGVKVPQGQEEREGPEEGHPRLRVLHRPERQRPGHAAVHLPVRSRLSTARVVAGGALPECAARGDTIRRERNHGRRKRREGRQAASWARARGRALAANWAACFLVLMLIVFSLTGRNFLSIVNFQNVVHLQTVPFLLATAETFVIITGGIDLSVGFVMGLASVGAAQAHAALPRGAACPPGWAIACAIADRPRRLPPARA